MQKQAATFAVRISGESMTGAGLFPGDVAVVDRSLMPSNGSIVLASIEGQFTIIRHMRKPMAWPDVSPQPANEAGFYIPYVDKFHELGAKHHRAIDESTAGRPHPTQCRPSPG